MKLLLYNYIILLLLYMKVTRQSKERGTFGKGVEKILVQAEDVSYLPVFAALA